MFTTRTVARDSADAVALKEIHHKLIQGLGLARGVTHAEFLKAYSDNRFYFIEVAARVGGAYISNMIETATGVNLWREWAHLEVAAGKMPYQFRRRVEDYSGVIVSLARQQEPDTSGVRGAGNRGTHHEVPPCGIRAEVAFTAASKSCWLRIASGLL